MELVTICSLISQIQYEDADGRTLPVTTILRQQQFCKQHVSPGMRNIRHLLYTNTQVFTLFEESWDKWRDACGTFVWTLSPPIKVASPYQRNSTPPPLSRDYRMSTRQAAIDCSIILPVLSISVTLWTIRLHYTVKESGRAGGTSGSNLTL